MVPMDGQIYIALR